MGKYLAMSYPDILLLSLITMCVSAVMLPEFGPPCKSSNDAGYYPNPEDCLTFYQCTFGKPILRECAPGTAWDTPAMICNHISVVPNCPDTKSDTTSTLLTRQFTSTALELESTTTEYQTERTTIGDQTTRSTPDASTSVATPQTTSTPINTSPQQITTTDAVMATPNKITLGDRTTLSPQEPSTYDAAHQTTRTSMKTSPFLGITTYSLLGATERTTSDDQKPQLSSERSTSDAAPITSMPMNYSMSRISATTDNHASPSKSNVDTSHATEMVESSTLAVATSETRDIAFNNSESRKYATSSFESSTTISARNEVGSTSIHALHAVSNTTINSTKVVDMLPTNRCTTKEENEKVTREAFSCDCNASRYTVVDDEKLEKIISEMKIDVKSLSSSRRKLTSAPDSRPSAMGVGLLGTILLITVVTAIVCPDVWSLINNVLIVRTRSMSQA